MDKQIAEQLAQMLQTELADRHSLFQLQCFVLGKEPTHQGKLWQCLREVRARKQSLDALDLEIADKQDDLELLELNTIGATGKQAEILERKKQRQKQSLERHIQNLMKKKKDLEEEVEFFVTAFFKLHEKEPLKHWDDIEVQKEYWNAKLDQELKLRMYLKQMPDVETVKTILALNEDAPVKKKTIDLIRQYINSNNQLPKG